jgi:hypothetical protein
LTRAQLKVLFDELEWEMDEEEMLSNIEQAPRVGGAFSTIVEEDSRLSAESSVHDAAARQLVAGPSRLIIDSAQATQPIAAGGERQLTEEGSS